MHFSTRLLNKIGRVAVPNTAGNVIGQWFLLAFKNLLALTTLSVTRIAYRLNFSDTSNFAKFFKLQASGKILEYRLRILSLIYRL
jgi:AraC-like DNA-binding protein